MNQIKPGKWTSEWYELATTDELLLSLKEIRHMLKDDAKKITQRSTWNDKIRRISEELTQRKLAGEEFEEF